MNWVWFLVLNMYNRLLPHTGPVFATQGQDEEVNPLLYLRPVVETRENRYAPTTQILPCGSATGRRVIEECFAAVPFRLSRFDAMVLLLHVVHCTEGKYAEAGPLYVRCLEIQGKVLGHDHPNLATTLHNAAALFTTRYELPGTARNVVCVGRALLD